MRTVPLPEDRALFEVPSRDGSVRFRCPICDQLTATDADTVCGGCAAVAAGGDR